MSDKTGTKHGVTSGGASLGTKPVLKIKTITHTIKLKPITIRGI